MNGAKEACSLRTATSTTGKSRVYIWHSAGMWRCGSWREDRIFLGLERQYGMFFDDNGDNYGQQSLFG